MPSSKAFCSALEQADQNLAVAIEQLVAEPLNIGGSLQTLKSVAEDLERAKKSLMAGDQAVRELVKKLEIKTARAQLLLDAAANLYCGSISVAMRVAPSYRPDGEMQPGTQRGCLQMDA